MTRFNNRLWLVSFFKALVSLRNKRDKKNVARFEEGGAVFEDFPDSDAVSNYDYAYAYDDEMVYAEKKVFVGYIDGVLNFCHVFPRSIRDSINWLAFNLNVENLSVEDEEEPTPFASFGDSTSRKVPNFDAAIRKGIKHAEYIKKVLEDTLGFAPAFIEDMEEAKKIAGPIPKLVSKHTKKRKRPARTEGGVFQEDGGGRFFRYAYLEDGKHYLGVATYTTYENAFDAMKKFGVEEA